MPTFDNHPSFAKNIAVESEQTPLNIPAPLMDGVDLAQQAKELRHICDHLDPFSPQDSGETSELTELLGKYVAKPEKEDPFALTNRLLSLLEDSLAELRKREESE